MNFRRGFKADAERLATELRSRIGLIATEPLNQDRLADLLNARIVSADTLVPLARLAELKALQDDAFSACTFALDNGTVIVYNPLASLGRRNSDIAHELAHLALDHKLRRTEKIGAFPFFTCDADQEAEANWLAGVLLLPRAALVESLKRGLGVEEIASKYGTSSPMARFRMNSTGAYVQTQRARQLGSNPQGQSPIR
jgi:Zn-dependent peptidase ImmA (M78 family)